MVVRVEAHPRFYTDTTGTCPCAVPGHIHSAFWPRIFSVVFKAPAFLKRGQEGVQEVLNEAIKKWLPKKARTKPS